MAGTFSGMKQTTPGERLSTGASATAKASSDTGYIMLENALDLVKEQVQLVPQPRQDHDDEQHDGPHADQFVPAYLSGHRVSFVLNFRSREQP